MILFSAVKCNMNSPCLKGNLKLVQDECQCSASVIYVVLHHAFDYKHVCLLMDGSFCHNCDTHLTICKITAPLLQLLERHHTCTIHSHHQSVNVHRFQGLCPEKMESSRQSFLVHSFRGLPFSNWYCTSTFPALGPHTNIWQSNSLIWSLVSQEWNSKTYFLTYPCTYGNSCL